MVFLDTNVIAYAVDEKDGRRHEQALSILDQALDGGEFAISTQVLSEFSCVALRKYKISPAQVREMLDVLQTIKCEQVDPAMITRAVEIQAIYGIQFYDAQIVAAAERAGATELWSEDFNVGQVYCGVRTAYPFAMEEK